MILELYKDGVFEGNFTSFTEIKEYLKVTKLIWIKNIYNGRYEQTDLKGRPCVPFWLQKYSIVAEFTGDEYLADLMEFKNTIDEKAI